MQRSDFKGIQAWQHFNYQADADGHYEAYKILENATFTYTDGTSSVESNTV
jgi:hypothetical protein